MSLIRNYLDNSPTFFSKFPDKVQFQNLISNFHFKQFFNKMNALFTHLHSIHVQVLFQQFQSQTNYLNNTTKFRWIFNRQKDVSIYLHLIQMILFRSCKNVI